MTDGQILEDVYNNAGLPKHLKDFIEQEWQKQDDREESLKMKMLSENPSKKWYTDVRDMERHRGLEIGPDGTVTEVK